MIDPPTARDRLARQAVLALSPEERVRRHAAMQHEAFDRLRANPEGWERFLRRNLKARARRSEADYCLASTED
ncbi:MAG: hypothetical protein ACFB21_12870 [Opitutales bacterium]